jgi:hypothetical protein
MKRPTQTTSKGGNAICLLVSLVFVAAIRSSLAAGDDSQSVPAKEIALNSQTQIECTTPDGRVAAVPTVRGANQTAAALLTSDETLSCPLQEGRTTFVIKLPETPLVDRFTFVNENAAAAGELKISVSSCQLPATSPKWMEVGGNISFKHKRLFNVSTVGVEARYLKLSFDVAKSDRLASGVSLSGPTLAINQ